MVEDEDDGGGEEDSNKADTETEDPVVSDTDVQVEGGEEGAPQDHIQHLREHAHTHTHHGDCLLNINQQLEITITRNYIHPSNKSVLSLPFM